MLGYPDQALRRGEEALAMAKELANAANLINTFAFVALVHVFRREPAVARERAKATMQLSAQHKNPYFLVWATALHGWTLTVEDQIENGVAEIDQGIAAYAAIGSQTWLPCFLVLRAETYARAKRTDDGLVAASEGLAVADQTDERCWEAELNRIKGELLLAVSSDNHAEAESHFTDALDIARRQQAKSWELRAAMSLSRLWHDQGKRKEAYELLSPIYGWFTEGFDTADLKDAKTLLKELA
jgi:predicted ATPase